MSNRPIIDVKEDYLRSFMVKHHTQRKGVGWEMCVLLLEKCFCGMIRIQGNACWSGGGGAQPFWEQVLPEYGVSFQNQSCWSVTFILSTFVDKPWGGGGGRVGRRSLNCTWVRSVRKSGRDLGQGELELASALSAAVPATCKDSFHLTDS